MSAPRALQRLDPELDQVLLSDGPTSLITTDRTLRYKVSSHLWGDTSFSDVDEYSTYIQYFITECEAWRLGGNPVAIQTYRDFLDLVQHLKIHQNDARGSPRIRSFFPPSPPLGEQASSTYGSLTPHRLAVPLAARQIYCSDDSVINALDLSVSLWLMLNTGYRGTTNFPGRSSLVWHEAQSLHDLIETSFTKTTGIGPSNWPQTLNLYNLDRIGGFNIVWTDHFADHLRFDDDLETVSIFHHASVLQAQSAFISNQ